MVTLLIFIVVLSVLVFVHEFGHFQTARWFGVKVEEFGFGFPPQALARERKGTVYSINWIPLGGFVKLKGEDGEDKSSQDSFASKKPWQRTIILLAGVLMNLVLCFVLLSVNFMVGAPQAIAPDELNKPYVNKPLVQISGLIKDGPSVKAGLQVGDKVLAIDGQKVLTPDDLISYVKSHQEQSQVQLIVERSSQEKIIEVGLAKVAEVGTDRKSLGVVLIQSAFVKYGFWQSWYQGFLATGFLIKEILTSLMRVFGSFFGLTASVAVSGPIGVAVMTGQAAALGFKYLLQFVAVLSLNLALINFLPFPALDGGRLLFVLIEKIRRRSVNQKIEAIVHNIGFGLLMLLVLVVSYNDLARYTGGIFSALKNLFT